MWFFVLFLLFEEGAQINIICMFWYRLSILKNAKLNIFVNHTNLLYSVQIKMNFFWSKTITFLFFPPRNKIYNNFENGFHILKLVFFP